MPNRFAYKLILWRCFLCYNSVKLTKTKQHHSSSSCLPHFSYKESVVREGTLISKPSVRLDLLTSSKTKKPFRCSLLFLRHLSRFTRSSTRGLSLLNFPKASQSSQIKKKYNQRCPSSSLSPYSCHPVSFQAIFSFLCLPKQHSTLKAGV